MIKMEQKVYKISTKDGKWLGASLWESKTGKVWRRIGDAKNAINMHYEKTDRKQMKNLIIHEYVTTKTKEFTVNYDKKSKKLNFEEKGA